MIGRHAADSYVGLPFVPHGDTREGVSCWGLVQLVYREQLAIALPGYPYAPEDRREITQAIQAAMVSGEWVSVIKPCDYDVVTMAHRQDPLHIGVVAAGRVLHASQRGGSVVAESLQQLGYRGYGRLRFWRHV